MKPWTAIIKASLRPLVTPRIRRSLRLYRYLQDIRQRGDGLLVLDQPPGSRALILAPHPDDEVIGPGGAIIKSIRAGCVVHCVYLTSGEASGGYPGLTPGERARRREMEARRGAEILGLERLDFLRHPDQGLSHDETIVDELAGIIADFKPNVVYLPSVTESHPDHLATNQILAHAYGKLGGTHSFDCLGYETVSTGIPNCLIPIDDVVGEKEAALRRHIVAQDAMNIVDTTLGLNRYRSLHVSGGQGYAEGFLYLPAKEYIALMNEVSGNV